MREEWRTPPLYPTPTSPKYMGLPVDPGPPPSPTARGTDLGVPLLPKDRLEDTVEATG